MSKVLKVSLWTLDMVIPSLNLTKHGTRASKWAWCLCIGHWWRQWWPWVWHIYFEFLPKNWNIRLQQLWRCRNWFCGLPHRLKRKVVHFQITATRWEKVMSRRHSIVSSCAFTSVPTPLLVVGALPQKKSPQSHSKWPLSHKSFLSLSPLFLASASSTS